MAGVLLMRKYIVALLSLFALVSFAAPTAALAAAPTVEQAKETARHRAAAICQQVMIANNYNVACITYDIACLTPNETTGTTTCIVVIEYASDAGWWRGTRDVVVNASGGFTESAEQVTPITAHQVSLATVKAQSAGYVTSRCDTAAYSPYNLPCSDSLLIGCRVTGASRWQCSASLSYATPTGWSDNGHTRHLVFDVTATTARGITKLSYYEVLFSGFVLEVSPGNC